MKSSKHFFIVVVLIVFAKQSDGSIFNFFSRGFFQTMEGLGKVATDVVGDEVSAIHESITSQVTDVKIYRGSGRARSALKTEASESKSVSANNEAIEIVLKGLLDTIDEVMLAEKAGYDGVKAARDSQHASYRVTIQNLEETFQRAKKIIGIAGTKAYQALGGATQLCEDGASQGLNDAIQIITGAGVVAYNGLEAAKSFVIQGIEAGRNATDHAILAANKGIETTFEATYTVIAMSGEKAFKAIRNESIPVEETSEIDLVIKAAVAKSPKCRNAIATINRSAEQARKYLLPGANLEAIKVAQNGLVDTCKSIAAAMQPSYIAIGSAQKSVDQETALALIEKGIASSKKECVAAIAYGHQALGGAAFIVRPKSNETLVDGIKILESARAHLTKGLDNALLFAVQGIKSNAEKSGLGAGRNGIATASFSAYAEIEKCAELIFKGILFP